VKKLHQALILIAIYLLALGVRVFWLSQKDGLHVDEGMAIAIACYNDYIIAENYEYGKKYTGKELKETSLVSDAGLKDALADMRSLRKDNRDSPHTNLYYTFFRLSLIGLKTSDIGQIVFRGGILNLVFFTVSFLFFFLLMRLLFAGSELLQYAATFCAFLSTAALSNTLFFRPYQIQETLFIVFCYFFIKAFDEKKYGVRGGKIYVNVKLLLLMSLITAFTLLSGYYAVIFIGFFGLYAVYSLCRNKRFAEIPYYFVVLGLGVLFARILYPNYISGFFSYRGQGVIETLSGDTLENLRSSIAAAGALLQKHFFGYMVIAVCVLCLAYTVIPLIREQKLAGLVQMLGGKKMHAKSSAGAELAVKKMACFVFIVSVLYLFVAVILAPYKILRYGMPVFPFLVILPAMLIYSIGTRLPKMAACAMLILCGSFALNAARESKIENIYRNKPDQYVFAQDKDTPVYVVNAFWSTWKYGNLIPYANDEQSYYFIDWYEYLGKYLETGRGNLGLPLPEAEDYSAIYLLTEYEPWLEGFDGLVVDNITVQGEAVQWTTESEFEINTGEPESWFPYFKGRKIFIAGR